MEDNLPRKWEYISDLLRKLKAPVKVIDAATEIDNLLVQLGLDYPTAEWEDDYFKRLHLKTVGYYKLYHKVVMDACSCTACEESATHCFLCKLGGIDGCTPRRKYADNYYAIVHHWIADEIEREEFQR